MSDAEKQLTDGEKQLIDGEKQVTSAEKHLSGLCGQVSASFLAGAFYFAVSSAFPAPCAMLCKPAYNSAVHRARVRNARRLRADARGVRKRWRD